MEFRYQCHDRQYRVHLEAQPDGSIVARVGDQSYHVQVQRSQPGQFNLIVNGRRIHAYAAEQRSANTGLRHHYVALVDREVQHFEFITAPTTPIPSRTPSTGSGGLKAQMPGQIMEVPVAEGDRVEKGQVLLILEAMKMEIRITSPIDGIVTRLLVSERDTVDRGQQLAEVSPEITVED